MSPNRDSYPGFVAWQADTLASTRFDEAARIRRAALRRDLHTANRIVEQAVLSWRLKERVYRLALSSLLYDASDLEHMQFVLADNDNDEGVGVAVWEEADRRDAPAGMNALLLHGLYVIPEWQGWGTGTRLLEFAQAWAAGRGFDGIVLRTWRESEVFFRDRGFSSLDVEHAPTYPRRLWRQTA